MGGIHARNYTSGTHGISRRLECGRGRARPWLWYEAWGQFVTHARKKQRIERQRWPSRRRRATTGGRATIIPESRSLRLDALPLDIIECGFQESHAACRINSRTGHASKWYIASLALRNRWRLQQIEKSLNIQVTSATSLESLYCRDVT